MNSPVREYLRKYPSARPATLVLIERKAAKTAQLREEVERAKESNRTAGQRLKYYAGKLKELAGAWR